MRIRTPRLDSRTRSARASRRPRAAFAVALAAGLVAATALTGVDVALSSSAAAQPTGTSFPFVTPNTDSCPDRISPPPPIDESEVPEPGQTAPKPLPVPASPVGGGKLGGCGLLLPDGAPPAPKDISATAWVIADLDTGKVLAAKDPHGRYRPASTMKTLLAAVALPQLDLNKVVIGTQDDANADGTRVGIGPGGRYTNEQLLHALLMCSGNDAAHAIAMQLGGIDSTLRQMDAKAKELHALDTRAATPSGLDGPGMSMSAYDLATIFRHDMTIPTFADIVHTEEYNFPGYPANPKIPGDQDHPGFPIANDNRLLYDYDGDLGGKTGYTDDARQTFVTAAQRGGHRLVVTMLKADVLPIRPPQQAARLLDYGFSLPSGANIGSLPGSGTDENSTPDVALATPPAHGVGASAPSINHDHENLRTTLIVVGLAVVLILVVLVWRINGRTPH
ncbi:D-alanyl-D-alanine carboxypeptidase family protein [Nocardia miyunensis]|uniref:D-alanyl-D-alanine carboxypeptidase family protein n=1 Tax=Nocardia miyunensis TaxID=282684 RepID=UPI00082A3748|nr:D-alanyl-D-alanine carboxypeptidase family protein [Nocardia miyunensis]